MCTGTVFSNYLCIKAGSINKPFRVANEDLPKCHQRSFPQIHFATTDPKKRYKALKKIRRSIPQRTGDTEKEYTSPTTEPQVNIESKIFGCGLLRKYYLKRALNGPLLTYLLLNLN